MQNWTLFPYLSRVSFWNQWCPPPPPRPPSCSREASLQSSRAPGQERRVPLPGDSVRGHAGTSCASQETACAVTPALPVPPSPSAPEFFRATGTSEDWIRSRQTPILGSAQCFQKERATVGRAHWFSEHGRRLTVVTAPEQTLGDRRARVAGQEFHTLVLFLIPAFCFVL